MNCKPLWAFAHNFLVHPLEGVLNLLFWTEEPDVGWLDSLHTYVARKAFGGDEDVEGDAQEFLDDVCREVYYQGSDVVYVVRKGEYLMSSVFVHEDSDFDRETLLDYIRENVDW